MKLDELKEIVKISNDVFETFKHFLTHYDSKTNQLLIIVGFEIATLTLLLNLYIQNIELYNDFFKILVPIFFLIQLISIFIILIYTKNVLESHLVSPHGKSEILSIRYFMDVADNWTEAEYIDVFLGKISSRTKKQISENEIENLLEDFIQGTAKSSYAHAHILKLKALNIKKAFEVAIFVFALILISIGFFIITLGVG